MADPATVGDLAVAVGDRRLRVTFRSGCVDDGQLVRVPHWAHLPRTWPDAGARPCARESDQRHAVVVAAIAALQLRREVNGAAGWVVQRLACSPAGQDLRSWQILGRCLNYRSGWAEHRHRETLARAGRGPADAGDRRQSL